MKVFHYLSTALKKINCSTVKIMPKCRICNANESKQLVRAEYVFGGEDEHKFWCCSNCDAVYLYPIPSIEEDAYFYRKEFEKFMSQRSGRDRDWTNVQAHIKTNQDQVQRRWHFLEPYLTKNIDLLELGCSSGFMLDAFSDFGAICTGVEPSGKFSEYLEEKPYPVFESIEDLIYSTPNVTFDLIVHFFLFEHIRDPFKFLESTLSLLKVNGKMIAEIPCVNDPLTSCYNVPNFEKFYWSIAHHFYYSPRSLSYILDKMGLKYELIPEQRYDLSNHIYWMTEGKPGGQGKYNNIFSAELIKKYKEDLKNKLKCDTIFLIIFK